MDSFKNHRTDIPARYVYGIQSGQFIKIGVATSVSKRLHIMRLSNPHPLKVVFRRRIQAAFYFERKMHELLADKAVGREWFEVTVEEVIAAADEAGSYAKEIRNLALKHLRRLSDTPPTQENRSEIEKLSETGT